jgi:hypothetical protein
MACHRTFVRVDTHEQLARFCELQDELPVVRDELLHGFRVAKVAQVAEHRDEPLRFEWEGFDVERGTADGRVQDVLVGDLVGEEGVDDGEEPRDELVVAHDVEGDGGYGEQLQSKILDGCLSFAVDEEIGVDNAMVDVCKVARWKIKLAYEL